jgi:hypothetical protein
LNNAHGPIAIAINRWGATDDRSVTSSASVKASCWA